MGLFGNLLGAVIDVVTTPVDLVRDAVDAVNGENIGESHTLDKLDKIGDKLSQAADDAAEGKL
jgi:hypothetical protein